MSMIRITEKIWIGGSSSWVNAPALGIGTVLNVAHDLRSECGWPDVEYVQIGLIDGPGNAPCMYSAAVLALAGMLDRHMDRHGVLVYCHDGSRSMAVVTMLMCAASRMSWDDVLVLLNERVDIDLPVPHPAHKVAFDNIDWSCVRKLVEN